MISITVSSFSGKLRLIALSSVALLLLFSWCNYVDYKPLPSSYHDVLDFGEAAAAAVATPESMVLLKSSSSEPMLTVVPSATPSMITPASSKAMFKEPSLSTFKTSTVSKTPVKSTTKPSPSPKAKEPLGAIVAAAMGSTNTSWMAQLAADWTLFPYVVDSPSPIPQFQIPQNKGHEAMVYLTFILNNWHRLPPRVVFVHGHFNSWHQDGHDAVHLIRSLRLPALETAGYVPLRCDWYPSCPAEMRPITHDAVAWGPGVHREDAERGIADAWDTLFPGTPIPATIASQCCAQFAVTRAAIQRRSRADYERMRDWILQTELEDDVSGRVLEKLWAFIMTGDAVHCPPPQQCACEYFGQCAEREWPVPPEGLQMWPSE